MDTISLFFKKYIYRILHKRRAENIIIQSGAIADLRTVFEGYNSLGRNSKISHSKVGLGTYIAGNTSLTRVKIGRFCSIGQYVRNSFGVHPTNFVSTHPAFYSNQSQAGFTFSKDTLIKEHVYVDEENKYLIEIGNDVWIGYDVKIMDGVKIGDGAIIAMGAIVTKDVEPYSIVGGIPAKHIKYRFSSERIEILKKFGWWEKDLEWIKKHRNSFLDVNAFFNFLEDSSEEH